jgi:hypothetical protein
MRREKRINFRLTDDQFGRFGALLGKNYRWTWTEVVIEALERYWVQCGSPERSDAGPAVRQSGATLEPDLFTNATPVNGKAKKRQSRASTTRPSPAGTRKAPKKSKGIPMEWKNGGWRKAKSQLNSR